MSGRKFVAIVLAVTVFAGAVGWYASGRVKSSDEVAAETAEPVASRITVPVEFEVLSSTVTLRGDIRFQESEDLSVPPPSAEAAIVTRVPMEAGDLLNEGELLVEVGGRPVFVLAGELPMFREMRPGLEGEDVVQLQKALGRLGYAAGGEDGVFGEATREALEKFYADRGYVARGPTADEVEQLRGLSQQVDAARTQLRAAEKRLSEAGAAVPESVRLQLDKSVKDAEDALVGVRVELTEAQAQADTDVCLP